VRPDSTPIVAKVLYWLVGAPAAFLAVMYTGAMPLVLLGAADERPPILNLVIAPYVVLVFVAAAFVAWACWRAVRGEVPAVAFRPFPGRVWAIAAVVGFFWGVVGYMRAA